MALDATVGGANANSFVTLAEANTYIANHWLTSRATLWATLSDAQKESALKVAVQIIQGHKFLDDEYSTGALPLALVEDSNYTISIHRQLVDQALVFPRNLDVDADGNPFIPQDVKDAQCEQAVFMLSVDEGQLATQLSGVVEEAAGVGGGVRLYQQFGSKGSMLAPLTFELLKKYIRWTGVRIRRS